ncbi:MAG: T9SS C-terminal target domain-containing protein [Bacteroidetes bacterium]|nr:MAG: T9SS C-terminal target domain-containing protein [Bacteroidota bacterium]
MKKIFTKLLFITIVTILMNQTVYAEIDSVSCTFFMYPKASVDCQTYIVYQGNAGTNATYTWDFDGATVVSGSGPGPYIVTWSSIGYKTVTLTVIYYQDSCTSSRTIHIVDSPTVYSVTGGGSYPNGGSGVHIYLSGSQVNYTYYLYLNGNTSPVTNKAGTGSQLDFGLFTTPGVYTCKAKVDSSSSMCLVNMSDSAVVSISGYVPIPYICMVKYDTTTSQNLIVWNKYLTQLLSHYNIYRQTYQFNVFEKVAEVPYTDFSTYLDTTANPLIMAYKYELTASDTAGNESEKSPYHKTVHLEVSPGISGFNLIWNTYEGFSFNTYRIHRKLGTGPWQVIDSIPSDLISYTDPYVTTGYAYYYLEVKRPYPCYPSLKTGTFESVISNIGMAVPLGFTEATESRILLYPNPVQQTLYILFPGSDQPSGTIELFSIDGRTRIEQVLLSSRSELNLFSLPAGLYIVRIRNNDGIFVRKVFKE